MRLWLDELLADGGGEFEDAPLWHKVNSCRKNPEALAPPTMIMVTTPHPTTVHPSSYTSFLDNHQSAASCSVCHLATCLMKEKQGSTEDLVLREDLTVTAWNPNAQTVPVGSNCRSMISTLTIFSSDMRCEESLNATYQILKEAPLTEISIRNDVAVTLNPAILDRLLIAVSENRHETLRIFRCQLSATPRSEAILALLATMSSLDELHLTFDPSNRDSSEMHPTSNGPGERDDVRLPTLPARTFDGVALEPLGRAGSLSRLTLSLDFTPELVLCLECVVREGRLNSLMLVNRGPHLSGQPIVAALSKASSLLHLTLERFDLVDASRDTLSSQMEGDDAVNSSLQELVLTHCRIERGALHLPCRGLRRLSLSHSEVRTELERHLLQEQGPEALIQRMLYHATFSSFRILGGGLCPADALFRCQDGTTALQLLRLLQYNPSLTALECVGLPKTLAVREELEYYLKLNRAGRSLDGLKLVPALWPKLLVRHTNSTESRFHPSIMRHLFVKHHAAFVGLR